uniref:Uncharacterized protein n=1 Tax=Setaria viridis TaxID=4556 RepID=A0A4U6V1D3_SETVI|nr:hypothetical protein SEVIR_4G145301v2 [Setaria viridis]
MYSIFMILLLCCYSILLCWYEFVLPETERFVRDNLLGRRCVDLEFSEIGIQVVSD